MKELDEKDRRILYLVYQNPDISQSELSEDLKISQPAVSARLNKLREIGVLNHFIGADIKKSQMFLARADIVTTSTESAIDFFDKCPLYLNGFLSSGKYNFTVHLLGENMRSIMSCVETHIRTNPIVKDMELNLIMVPTRDYIVPVKPTLDKKETTPCQVDCCHCNLYMNNRCLGCPISIHYRGNLL